MICCTLYRYSSKSSKCYVIPTIECSNVYIFNEFLWACDHYHKVTWPSNDIIKWCPGWVSSCSNIKQGYPYWAPYSDLSSFSGLHSVIQTVTNRLLGNTFFLLHFSKCCLRIALLVVNHGITDSHISQLNFEKDVKCNGAGVTLMWTMSELSGSLKWASVL